MTSEPELRKSKASAVALKGQLPIDMPLQPLGSPSPPNIKNTLIVIGVIMILAGYGFAGYVLYKRLCQMEEEIKKTSRQIEDERMLKDAQFEFVDEMIENDLIDSDQYQEHDEHVPTPAQPSPLQVSLVPESKRKGGVRRGKKKTIIIDVPDQPLSEEKDTLVPSDDL